MFIKAIHHRSSAQSTWQGASAAFMVFRYPFHGSGDQSIRELLLEIGCGEGEEINQGTYYAYTEGSCAKARFTENGLQFDSLDYLNDALSNSLGMYITQELSLIEDGEYRHLDPMVLTLMTYLIKKETARKTQLEKGKVALTPYNLRKIDNYIQEHIDQDISSSDLAELVGLSRFHFIRTFKKAVGETPHNYVNKLRMERAKAFLRETNEPIIQVGFETGFENPSHFSQVFKRFFGITPQQFRKTFQTHTLTIST